MPTFAAARAPRLLATGGDKRTGSHISHHISLVGLLRLLRWLLLGLWCCLVGCSRCCWHWLRLGLRRALQVTQQCRHALCLLGSRGAHAPGLLAARCHKCAGCHISHHIALVCCGRRELLRRLEGLPLRLLRRRRGLLLARLLLLRRREAAAVAAAGQRPSGCWSAAAACAAEAHCVSQLPGQPRLPGRGVFARGCCAPGPAAGPQGDKPAGRHGLTRIKLKLCSQHGLHALGLRRAGLGCSTRRRAACGPGAARCCRLRGGCCCAGGSWAHRLEVAGVAIQQAHLAALLLWLLLSAGCTPSTSAGGAAWLRHRRRGGCCTHSRPRPGRLQVLRLGWLLQHRLLRGRRAGVALELRSRGPVLPLPVPVRRRLVVGRRRWRAALRLLLLEGRAVPRRAQRLLLLRVLLLEVGWRPRPLLLRLLLLVGRAVGHLRAWRSSAPGLRRRR